MSPSVDPKLLLDPVFQRVLKEGLAIQDRFSAEPVYARTGKGCLKPSGVGEISWRPLKRLWLAAWPDTSLQGWRPRRRTKRSAIFARDSERTRRLGLEFEA